MKTLQNSTQTFFGQMESAPLMSSREASRAKIFQLLESEKGLAQREVVSGQRSLDSFASYDRNTLLWRTSQTSLLGQANIGEDGLDEFSETWPSAGTMRNGKTYRRQPWALPIAANASGLLPTPTKSDARTHHSDCRRFDSLSVELRKQHGYPSRPNPLFLAWMMGFPEDWASVPPTETP